MALDRPRFCSPWPGTGASAGGLGAALLPAAGALALRALSAITLAQNSSSDSTPAAATSEL